MVVARLLTSLCVTDWHSRHWSANKEGFCLLCPGKNLPGTLEHLLVTCDALDEKRHLLSKYVYEQTEDKPQLRSLFQAMFGSSLEDLVQFLLDPSVTPTVISGCQDNLFTLNEIFSLTRTYCY